MKHMTLSLPLSSFFTLEIIALQMKILGAVRRRSRGSPLPSDEPRWKGHVAEIPCGMTVWLLVTVIEFDGEVVEAHGVESEGTKVVEEGNVPIFFFWIKKKLAVPIMH